MRKVSVLFLICILLTVGYVDGVQTADSHTVSCLEQADAVIYHVSEDICQQAFYTPAEPSFRLTVCYQTGIRRGLFGSSVVYSYICPYDLAGNFYSQLKKSLAEEDAGYFSHRIIVGYLHQQDGEKG